MKGWYINAKDLYVPAKNASKYPVRQGDVVHGSFLPVDWAAGQVVHPTCELTKPSVKTVQIARVHALADLASDFERQLVITGFRELENGETRIDAAHTFFLPKRSKAQKDTFVTFRELTSISANHLTNKSRVLTLTHEGRVTFIRRWIYFRFRWGLSYDEVQEAERVRISADPNFAGPRPVWAPLTASTF